MVASSDKYSESGLKKALNRTLVGVLKAISFLPFGILYLLSDFLYIVVYRIFGYRKKVVSENLKFAFPEKSEHEIKEIEKKFFHHFCDLAVEVVKLHRMSEAEIDKRVVFKGMAELNTYFEKGQNVIVLAMHHNNWEWGSLVHRKTGFTGVMVYDPLRGNQAMEKFMVESRTKWGGVCVAVHKSGRTVFDLNRTGKPTALWLGADQTPPSDSKLWAMFLNREAPFFSGPERIAVKTNQPVFFHEIKKTGRGCYEISYIPMFLKPAEILPNEIILEYIRKMEASIRNQPEYYLWSHRRWKHKKPDEIGIIG